MAEDILSTLPATTGSTPSHDGDGYGYGGDAVVIIGGTVIVLGPHDSDLALEIAARWNKHIGETCRPEILF